MIDTLQPNQYLELISPIKQEALILKNEADKISAVTDELTHRQAAEIRKKITSFLTNSEKKRKDLTKPILDFEKQIDNLAEDSIAPALQSKQALTDLILTYETELERQKQIELARIAEVKRPFLVADLKPTLEGNKEMLKKVKVYFQSLAITDQENPTILDACNSFCERIKEKMLLQNEEIERAKEAKRLAEIAKEQNAEKAKLEAEKIEIQRQEREQQAQKQRLANEAIQAEINRKTQIAKQQEESVRVKTGLKERTTFEIVEANLIPREFCEPSDKLINQAIKNGILEIPGIKIFKIKS